MFKMRSSCSIYRYQIVIAFDARTSGKPTPGVPNTFSHINRCCFVYNMSIQLLLIDRVTCILIAYKKDMAPCLRDQSLDVNRAACEDLMMQDWGEKTPFGIFLSSLLKGCQCHFYDLFFRSLVRLIIPNTTSLNTEMKLKYLEYLFLHANLSLVQHVKNC